jgi:isopentenyl phosphate kinase
MDSLVFLKLGGSLITDKTRPYIPRRRVLRRLAGEVRGALDVCPHMRLLIGHGSGSFGHQAAAVHGTRNGVQGGEAWRGFAEVATAAARLNRIVCDAFAEGGIPVLGLQPSASAMCCDGTLVQLAMGPAEEALRRGLVPLIYGDVALDQVRGGTIVSTEALFAFMAGALQPQRILLAGVDAGVLDEAAGVVQRITPERLPELRGVLGESQAIDVTGGMADKVISMVELVAEQPDLEVRIFSGLERGLVGRVLREPGFEAGTLIAAG